MTKRKTIAERKDAVLWGPEHEAAVEEMVHSGWTRSGAERDVLETAEWDLECERREKQERSSGETRT